MQSKFYDLIESNKMNTLEEMLEVISKFAPEYTTKKTPTKVQIFSDKVCKNKIGSGKNLREAIISTFNTAVYFNNFWSKCSSGRLFPDSFIQLVGGEWFAFNGENQMAKPANHHLNINAWDYENKHYYENLGKKDSLL